MREYCVLTNEDFKKAGYTRYDPPPIHDCVTDLWQKWFTDDKGKRYAITAERWDFSKITWNAPEPNFQWSVQFTHKETQNTVDIDCLAGWSIEDTEEFYATQWATGLYDYYEKWYGEDEEDE